MNGFVLAPAALGDLEDLWDYYAIELQNPEAADRLRDEMFEAFRKLVKTPGWGIFAATCPKNRSVSGGCASIWWSTAAKNAPWKSSAFCTARATFKRYWDRPFPDPAQIRG